jgi:SAM-dependent methyltransferase
MQDSKLRFSDRVSDYKKYRPSYPAETISFILENCQVNREWKIADIGSGTGISSRLLSSGLKCSVYAVEPNREMREAAESEEKGNKFFHSTNGSAEATTLETSSMNMVCAFQAFHWFDRAKAREEFLRILKEPKWVLLAWNVRVTNEPGFLEEYQRLLTEFPEYRIVDHRNVTSNQMETFFGNSKLRKKQVKTIQELDWEVLKGRFSSSSYTPKVGTEKYKEAVQKLKGLFDKHNDHGMVKFKYDTQLFLGKMR